MSEQLKFQRISGYAWALMLLLAGGILVLASMAGSPTGDHETALAEGANGAGSAKDSLLQSEPYGTGIVPVGGMD